MSCSLPPNHSIPRSRPVARTRPAGTPPVVRLVPWRMVVPSSLAAAHSTQLHADPRRPPRPAIRRPPLAILVRPSGPAATAHSLLSLDPTTPPPASFSLGLALRCRTFRQRRGLPSRRVLPSMSILLKKRRPRLKPDPIARRELLNGPRHAVLGAGPNQPACRLPSPARSNPRIHSPAKRHPVSPAPFDPPWTIPVAGVISLWRPLVRACPRFDPWLRRLAQLFLLRHRPDRALSSRCRKVFPSDLDGPSRSRIPFQPDRRQARFH